MQLCRPPVLRRWENQRMLSSSTWQSLSLSKSCYYHIRQLLYLHFTTVCIIAIFVVQSKLAYSTCLYCNFSKCQITSLQQIQNSFACVVVKAPTYCHTTPVLRCRHCGLTITERIEYKLLSLTHKILTTTQPSYLHNLISFQPPRSTRSSSLVTRSSTCHHPHSFRDACLYGINSLLLSVILSPIFLSATHFFLHLKRLLLNHHSHHPTPSVFHS